MKTPGTGLLICGMMLAAQSVLGQTAPAGSNQNVPPSITNPTAEPAQPVASLVLPDLNPLDLATAQSVAAANDQDVIVVIGALWCGPCQTLKNYVMPQVAQRGGLERLQFAYLDFDEQNEIATGLMNGTVVPQVVYMTRKQGQWKPLAVIPRMVEADIVVDFIQWARSPSTRDPKSGAKPVPMLPPGDG